MPVAHPALRLTHTRAPERPTFQSPRTEPRNTFTISLTRHFTHDLLRFGRLPAEGEPENSGKSGRIAEKTGVKLTRGLLPWPVFGKP